MSGTQSLFPELSSTGRCEILQLLGACQGDSMLTAEHKGESPPIGMYAVEGKLQKRVPKKSQFLEHFAGIDTWPETAHVLVSSYV